jgi:hypothetical protein
MRNAQKTLHGKSERMKPLETSGSRREDNIKIDLREIWLEGVDWIQLAQDRGPCRAPVNTVMDLPVQQQTRNL